MSYLEIISQIDTLIGAALNELDLKDAKYSILETPSPELGEFSTNLAFNVSKIKRISPSEAASKLADIMMNRKSTMISSVKAHQNGYINFYINYNALIKEIFEKGSIKLPKAEKSLRVSVEHTSVNPNKALHIGHARNVAIGDSVARILQQYGHDVSVLNYIDDTGVQVADVVLGLIHLDIPLQKDDQKFDHYIGDVVYVRVNREYEKRPELLEKRKEISRRIELGEGKEAELAHLVTRKVLDAQLSTCWRLGAEYDLLNFESDILRAGYWKDIFEILKRKGIVKLQKGGKYDGCWVMEGDEDEEEKVLVRSDGTAVYAAKDIPYAAWKLGIIDDRFSYKLYCEQPSGKKLWSTSVDNEPQKEIIEKRFSDSDMTIAVIDVGQSRLQKFVKKAINSLSPKGKDYIHLGYEKVYLSKKTAQLLFGEQVKAGDSGIVGMKGRSGLYVNVDDLLDKLKSKAAEETRKRNPDKDSIFIETVAEAIAVSSLRYELLKQDLNKAIIFDIDDSLRLEGDTASYLMYSYARACSILRKGWDINLADTKVPAALAEQDRRLIMQLIRMGYELNESVRYLTPKPLARYAHMLAVTFNNFYESCPVLSAEKDIADFRIALVKLFRDVMGSSLDLLGIKHPEEI